MDSNTLQPYKDAVTSANNEYSSSVSQTPQLLNQLKTNLTSIFAKDNPFIAERGTALQNYLNAPSQSRASTLPSNMPMVEGSNLNLSPTQQNAVTTSARNAALVPLLNLNQIVTGLYGNIPGMVSGAADLYNAQNEGLRMKAQTASQSLAQAFAEMQAQESARQFQQKLEEERRQFDRTLAQKAAGSSTGDFSTALLAAMGYGAGGNNQQQQTTNNSTTLERPDLSNFEMSNQGDSRNTASDFFGGLGLAGKNALSWLGNNIAWPKG